MKFSLMQKLTERWSRMPEADRRRVPLIIGIFGVAAALLLHALLTMPAKTKAEQDWSRMSGRQSQLAKVPKQAVPRWTGRSAGALRHEVNGLKEELQTQKARLADLEPRFASLAEVEATRELFDALTRLAESGDMEIESLEQKGLKREERDQPPSAARLNNLARQNPYLRPLVQIKARASYRGLMHFLDGLPQLPYTVAPLWISVEVKTDAVSGGRPRLQWLDVTMDLNL